MRKLTFGTKDGKEKVYYVCIDNLEEIKDGLYELIFDGVEKDNLSFLHRALWQSHLKSLPPFYFL